MARVEIAESAAIQTAALIEFHELPPSTTQRLERSLGLLARFPDSGARLRDDLRYVLGPWRWMLLIYRHDPNRSVVEVVAIEDARAADSSTTTERTPRR